MTLEEAIKQQEDALANKWCPWSPELKASIQLGTEALKRELSWRQRYPHQSHLPFPGETEE